MPTRVFLSHSSHTDADLRFTCDVAAALQARGYTVLFDRRRLQPGDDWNQELHEWLAWCHAGVLLLTPEALRSDWVLKEATILTWRRTLDPDFRLFPALLGGATVDQLSERKFAPLMIQAVQALSGSTPRQIADEVERVVGAEAEFDTPLDLLVGKLADILEQAGTNTIRSMARKLGVDAAAWAPGASSREQLVALIAGRIVRETLGEYGGVDALIEDLGVSPLQGGALRTVLDMVTPYWVPAEAACRLPEVMERGSDWAVALNGMHVPRFTAPMYVRRAFPLRLRRPVISLKGGGSDKMLDEAMRELRSAVKEKWRLDDDAPATVRGFLSRRDEPLFVVLPQPIPALPADLDRLRGEFPNVVFILQAGSGLDAVPPFGGLPSVEVLLPPVDIDREGEAYSRYLEADAIVREKGG